MPSIDNSEDYSNLRTEYEKVLPLAERMALGLVAQLNDLFDTEDITLGVQIERRVKSISSIFDKMDRKSIEISHINEINDLIGLRIILLFENDVHKVCELIKNNLDLIEHVDGYGRLGDTQFGYNSDHLIIRLPGSWLKLPSYKGMDELTAEIQVRTLAQHTWSVASHKLQYKREESVPAPLRRSINRVSALLETVDKEFSRVLSERDTYLSNVESISNNDKLNVETLEAILDNSLPPRNKWHEESYASLLDELIGHEITTRGDLEQLIANGIEHVLYEDQRMVKSILRNGEFEDSDEETRAHAGVYFTHTGLIRIALSALQ